MTGPTPPEPAPAARWDAAIVGGGLAGIAAAVALADRGARVVLLERTRRLGGRASSFEDAATGAELDNCQHVVMGCCTNYRSLIDRLGVGDRFDWHDEQFWVSEGGRVDRIGPGLLPAPAHHAGSFLRASFLSGGDKLAIARAMARLARTDARDWAGRSFADWLAAARQPERAVARFWRPVVVSACNAEPERAAADLAIKVFREGLLAGREAARIGVPKVGLSRLFDPVPELLAARGSLVRFGAMATRVTPGRVELRDGEAIEAGRVIVALPFERVAGIVDPVWHDGRIAGLGTLTHSPILGVHLRLDRPVLPHPHAVLVDRPTQWLFRKDDAGRWVHAVVSAADGWMQLDDAAITERVAADLRACFPAAGAFHVERSRPVRSKRASFLAGPGAFRPRVSPDDARGVILAGDYTDTGWPATMEGAVRSGFAAAACVIGVDPATMLTPDLRSAGLASAVLGRGA
jgi:zeta-carotene desaturase